MRGSITGDALYAQVVMQRQLDPRLCLLVEGDDEFSVLTGHVDESNVILLMGGAKSAVLRAVELLDQMNVDHALGLIDRDLDDLTGASASYPTRLVATRGYDLAADIFANELGLLRRAAVAHGGATRVTSVEAISGHDFTDLVYNLSIAIARLRLVNAEKAFGLNFRDFPFHDVITSDYSPADTEDILTRTNARSAVTVSYADIDALMADVDTRISNNRDHCGGHDIFDAAAAILRQAGATRVGASQIAASVFTAASCAVILSLPIYSQIEAWAAGHSLRAFTC